MKLGQITKYFNQKRATLYGIALSKKITMLVTRF